MIICLPLSISETEGAKITQQLILDFFQRNSKLESNEQYYWCDKVPENGQTTSPEELETDAKREASPDVVSLHEKNGFVTGTKLGTTNNFLLLQPKILLQ